MNISVKNFVQNTLGAAGIGAGAIFGGEAKAQEGPRLPLLAPSAIHAPENPGSESELPPPPSFPAIKPELAPAPFELHQAAPKKSAEPYFPNIDGRPLEGGAVRIPSKNEVEALRIESAEEAKNKLLFAQLDAISTALQDELCLPTTLSVKFPANASADKKIEAYANHFAELSPIVANANGRILGARTSGPVPFIPGATIVQSSEPPKQQLAKELGILEIAKCGNIFDPGYGDLLEQRIAFLNRVLKIDPTRFQNNPAEPQPTLADPRIQSFQDANPSPAPKAPEKSALENGPILLPQEITLPPLPAPTLESSSEDKFQAPRFQ